MFIFEIVTQSKTNFKSTAFIYYQPGLLRSLCVHRLPWIHTTWLCLYRDIHGVSLWTYICTYFFGKEINFIVIEKSIAVFLWKFSISCSLHDVTIGLLTSEYEEEMGKLVLWKQSVSEKWFKIYFELNGFYTHI